MDYQYWEIVINSPLSGAEIVRILASIHNVLPDIVFVEVDDVIGGGIGQFGENFPRIFEFNQLMSLCYPVAQMDWGDFFFIRDAVSVAMTTSYPDAIGKTPVTLRCVDSSMFNVYTNLPDLKEALLHEYNVVGISEGDLRDFQYPF